MTPTKEMIAMAERIADSKCRVRASSIWSVAYDAALTAIMETSEKAADYVWPFNYDAYEAIRNGEHLR